MMRPVCLVLSTSVGVVWCVAVAAGAVYATHEAQQDTLILQRATIIDGFTHEVAAT